MTGFKILVAASLLSMATISSANAQLPDWAISNPDAFQAQYPDRDALNGGALTPAGRMGLELAHGAAPAFGTVPHYRAHHAHAAIGRTAR
jgi:hypothetical protein